MDVFSFFSLIFFLFYRSRGPGDARIITIGSFPRPSATLPLHCINYRAGINLARRHGPLSDLCTGLRLASPLALRIGPFLYFSRATRSLHTSRERNGAGSRKKRDAGESARARERCYFWRGTLPKLNEFQAVSRGNAHGQREFHSRDHGRVDITAVYYSGVSRYASRPFSTERERKRSYKKREREGEFSRSNCTWIITVLLFILFEWRPLEEYERERGEGENHASS